MSSVAALSTLSITSRQQDVINQASLLLHHSRPAARFLAGDIPNPLPEHCHGTRVTVYNLFGNMPVRVKQRATSPSSGHKVDVKHFETLKRQLVALLLAFHNPVWLVLSSAKSDLTAQIGSKLTSGEVASVSRIGSQPSLGLQIPLVCKILSQAGYIDPESWTTWVKTSARTANVKILGAFSLQPAPSKMVQFISLGNKHVNQESCNSIFYEEVNRLFASSTFGVREEYSEIDGWGKSKDRRLKQGSFTAKQLKSGGKSVDRWPMFFIRIDIHSPHRTTSLEKEDHVNRILMVLAAMTNGFLESHLFGPHAIQKGQRKRKFLLESPQSAIPGSRNVAFDSWSRIKSGQSCRSSKILETEGPYWEDPKEFTIAQHNNGSKSDQVENQNMRNEAGEEIIEWTNPMTKTKTLINGRTGLVITRPSTALPKPVKSPTQRPLSAPGRLTQRCPRGFLIPPQGTWASEVISTWENPVFSLPKEAPVPRLQSSDLCYGATSRHAGRDSSPSILDPEKAFSHNTRLNPTKVSKGALQRCRIIAQVDGKFILVSTSPPSNLLVLIDQHAADEQKRLDNFFNKIKSQSPENLLKPLKFELQGRDSNHFLKYAPHFSPWGIHYDIDSVVTPSSNRLLTVKALPASIAERCRAEPKIIIDLLRSEVWKLAADDHLHNVPSSGLPPQGLVDLLSSRACRSAIMFNDELSMAEAESLVRRLVLCDFPFQCAHGRPSMVPIVEVAQQGTQETGGFADRKDLSSASTTGGEQKAKGFGNAWALWKAKPSER